MEKETPTALGATPTVLQQHLHNDTEEKEIGL